MEKGLAILECIRYTNYAAHYYVRRQENES